MSLVDPHLFIGANDQTSYLRSAGQGLVPQTAQAAVTKYLNIRGGLTDDTLLDCYWQCKEQVATLMQADAKDIAFMGSTSDACGAITSLIDWQPGDEVVLVSDTLEFPSVTLSVRRLERHGVVTRNTRQHKSDRRRNNCIINSALALAREAGVP